MNQQQQEVQAEKPGFWQNVKKGTYLGGIVAGTGTVLTKAGLAIYGFSSIGPVAGSIAAATQASIGSVAAGSAFAIAQGVAMSGLGVIALPAVGVGAAVGGGYVAYKHLKK
ncbi:unnamed protein product (macronuclear) [Paramecium tetraurelia]|uniref:Uncharacterized protein n=1 Tax=Paramecium tetraurelia TaxID=5888 RepID=A0BGU2_PARTE|nr:uncharacterized protein GSPATT00028794001 [Paramecium tetraurelia]CAK57759.1 unnamed protein product [Paramecium tetraurelia]|eukprot:XP_001425157.1 hypothetical protein (macronuclear) [Paramecium tetraurelia strain d4-2]